MPSEEHLPLPPNPRVNFFREQRDDMRDWRFLPIWLGVIALPLYEHRSIMQLVAIVAVISGLTALWNRWSTAWVEERMGVFRCHDFSAVQTGAELNDALNEMRRNRKRRWDATWKAWLTFACITLPAIFLLPNLTHSYQPNGTIEQMVCIALVQQILFQLQRAFERSNLPERRVWAGSAVVILLAGFFLMGATSSSYAALTVLVGVVPLVLSLLDMALLLHLAAGSHDMEEHHA